MNSINNRAFRVAIVGSGPSGFYAADALIKSDQDVMVDLFDRLPTPFGLVRGGVAPDHPKIKSVTRVYDGIAKSPQFNFLGNVNIGKDITVVELKEYYDAIVFTCGAETDRNLNIPGINLNGSHTATEFVGWYNGHPDYLNCTFDLSKEIAVIIGQGNVAVDVTRVLSKTVDELKHTDIAQHALDALSESKVREVHMIGRRSPVQAAFTNKEIRELGELLDCDLVFDNLSDFELNPANQKELDDKDNTGAQRNWKVFEELRNQKPTNKNRRCIIHFLKSPQSLIGSDWIESVVLEKNKLTGESGNQQAEGTGYTEKLECGLFFRSVGYRGVEIPGIPFEEKRGVFPNNKGRIMDNNDIVPGLYTAGWIKRGPSGVIGTNKADSVETIASLMEDMPKINSCNTPSTEPIKKLLQDRNINVVSFEDWQKIDAAEIERGKKVGKPREKFTKIEEMIATVNKQ